MFQSPRANTAVLSLTWQKKKKKQENDHLCEGWMTPEFVAFSGEFVMHKSINVFESGVTRVGSVIDWLRPYISKMSIRWEELTVIASGNNLQLISPSKYNSLFSASILAMTFSNSLLKLKCFPCYFATYKYSWLLITRTLAYSYLALTLESK